MKRYVEAERVSNPEFSLARDGVHPDELGHWLMAQAVLEHLGAAGVGAARSAPEFFATLPNGPAIFAKEKAEQAVWKDAWVTAIGHQRPGMKRGAPLEIDPQTGRARLRSMTETNAAPAWPGP
jgi:hypothetical protein